MYKKRKNQQWLLSLVLMTFFKVRKQFHLAIPFRPLWRNYRQQKEEQNFLVLGTSHHSYHYHHHQPGVFIYLNFTFIISTSLVPPAVRPL
jgi:hypothetical protein